MAVFVLGISGAFLTTSMQSDTNVEELIPILGFIPSATKPCDTPVSCNTVPTQVCKLFDTSGPQAKAMDSPTTCNRVVYRPQ